MPSHESYRPEPDDGRRERETYELVGRFDSGEKAGRIYQAIQDLIFDSRCDLSVFRVRLNAQWHVVTIGERPPSDIEDEIHSQLGQGALTALPDVVHEALLARRSAAIQQAPWVERHFPHS